METYSFGDWVVYDPGYKDPEIGRVTEDKGESAFVCYHAGCTAASTCKRSDRGRDTGSAGRHRAPPLRFLVPERE